MVCVDQLTAKRSDEPYSTLAKTRKVDGKVVFGRHICCVSEMDGDGIRDGVLLKAGDPVTPFYD